MAEGNGLLNRHTGNTVSWVRIPPSPPSLLCCIGFSGLSPSAHLPAHAVNGVGRGWTRSRRRWRQVHSNRPIDFALAELMNNYPSANYGYVWVGQARLGRERGFCGRTARRALRRMREAGLLVCKRGGPGKKATWTFCVDGVPVFGGAPDSGTERADGSALGSVPYKDFQRALSCDSRLPNRGGLDEEATLLAERCRVEADRAIDAAWPTRCSSG